MQNDTQSIVWDSFVSFAGLFGRGDITEIEIPMIQRDYAQGRNNGAVKRIRDNFLETLCGALLPGAKPVDLDFVYGDVDAGRFYPLDGQQRLTTLFLLHCYLSWQTGIDGKAQPWARFSYATRPGARKFCAFLAGARPELDGVPSAWIRDQPDFLPTWEFDPTIQSMLTMIDALHAKAREMNLKDFGHAFARLVDPEQPAIRFHMLPVQANGLTDKLYIKMNSRGKPLTEFENFKAHFETVLKSAGHAQADDFTKNVDTIWSDLLWDYRGGDDLIDDEFLRLFRCITEINAWNANIDFDARVRNDDLAESVYGSGQAHATGSAAFLFDAFGVWHDRHIRAEFERLFKLPGDAAVGRIPLFNAFKEEGVDLFAGCCRHYGRAQWTLAHTLLFYGVLVHLRDTPGDPAAPKRLRILRNLIDASDDAIRVGERNNMPKLLSDTAMLIRTGHLEQITTFNPAQVADEIAKAAMLASDPGLEAALHDLEDHDLLRGGLTAFDLDPARFARRAATFAKLFTRRGSEETQPYLALTGALLAQGDYARRSVRASGHLTCDLGAPRNSEPWSELFRGRKREKAQRITAPLRDLLDAVDEGRSLSDIVEEYLGRTKRKDWRYYFVRYDVMRRGASGHYTISPAGGYRACMLEKSSMGSDYYDPFLLAIVTESGIPPARIGNPKWPRCFTSYETVVRELSLRESRIGLRCVDDGWLITVPEPMRDGFEATAQRGAWGLLRSGADWQLPIAQDQGLDTEDRIKAGATLLQKLVEAGY